METYKIESGNLWPVDGIAGAIGRAVAEKKGYAIVEKGGFYDPVGSNHIIIGRGDRKENIEASLALIGKDRVDVGIEGDSEIARHLEAHFDLNRIIASTKSRRAA